LGGASAPFYDMVEPNISWRNDPGLSSVVEYKRRFAYLPVTCADGTRIWCESYYKKYLHWGHSHGNKIFDDDDYGHTDFVENITEAEYIIRKLAETL